MTASPWKNGANPTLPLIPSKLSRICSIVLSITSSAEIDFLLPFWKFSGLKITDMVIFNRKRKRDENHFGTTIKRTEGGKRADAKRDCGKISNPQRDLFALRKSSKGAAPLASCRLCGIFRRKRRLSFRIGKLKASERIIRRRSFLFSGIKDNGYYLAK